VKIYCTVTTLYEKKSREVELSNFFTASIYLKKQPVIRLPFLLDYHKADLECGLKKIYGFFLPSLK